MLDREALQNASNTLGGDLYILPSSIHEVLVLPSSILKPEELEVLVQSVNRTEVRPEDVLSDHVYHFDCQTKQLSMPVTRNLYEEEKPEGHTNSMERRFRR